MKCRPNILRFTAAVTLMLTFNIQAQTENPALLAVSPQTGEQKKVSACCLSPSELAAWQAKAERGDVSAQKTMADYYDYKIGHADFGSDVDDDIANYLKWLRKAAENGDCRLTEFAGI